MNALEEHFKRRIREELDACEFALKRLESSLSKEPEEVIHWISVENILRAANAIAYESGRWNGARQSLHHAPTPTSDSGEKE